MVTLDEQWNKLLVEYRIVFSVASESQNGVRGNAVIDVSYAKLENFVREHPGYANVLPKKQYPRSPQVILSAQQKTSDPKSIPEILTMLTVSGDVKISS
jgi:hypothetical protein